MLPKPSSRKHRLASDNELQIITFLNLMVILIPFLLMTTVFAKMAVIELTPPAASSEQPEQPPPVKKDEAAGFRLTIALLDDEITVLNGETTLGVYKKNADGTYDLTGLPPLLSQLKRQNPRENDAVILSRPNIPYMTVVEIIDAVRGQFPGISLNEL